MQASTHRSAITEAVYTVVLVLSCAMSADCSSVVIRDDADVNATLRLAEGFVAVGRVLPDGSCTLIAPTWVITAAHVAGPLVPGDKIQFGDDQYLVKRTVLHPEGNAPRGQPPEVDLALVELAEPVADIEPIEFYRAGAELGLELFIVGHGDFGKPSTGLSHGDGVRRAVTNSVVDAGPRRIFMKFDTPPSGTEFEGVGAPGDSGGPALLVENGKQYIVGVSSASMDGKPGQYGVTDVYTRVSAYLPWIDTVIKSHP